MMTVEEALEFADEWTNGHTFHDGSQGWRVVCMVLAKEVRQQRELETLQIQASNKCTDDE